ncbi:haloacid dehalogenase, type II [Cunninghamella echinulata]|nr:haloacid dehalogenase, type II [Cunninghamella echinulata]
MKEIKVIFFDVFGTVVDWYTGVSQQINTIVKETQVDLDVEAFTLAWRRKYSSSINQVNQGIKEWATVDSLQRTSLNELMDEYKIDKNKWNEETREKLILAWHFLPPWDDSIKGLSRLRQQYTLSTLSNGGMKLLVDMVKAAHLPFDCILSAELAKAYKPTSKTYLTMAALLDAQPHQCLMVACHKYDIEAAHQLGFHTAFIERPLENGPGRSTDTFDEVIKECDFKVKKLTELADKLGC